jgi:hypothetical protein
MCMFCIGFTEKHEHTFHCFIYSQLIQSFIDQNKLDSEGLNFVLQTDQIMQCIVYASGLQTFWSSTPISIKVIIT